MNDSTLIVWQPNSSGLPTFSLAADALRLRDSALEAAALIGRVQNATDNATAVDAQKQLKSVAQMFERQRKKVKEPLIEAGRQLDRLVQAETVELDKELARLSDLTTEFQLAEQRRIREEQEAQARELARIEAWRQEELAKIALESPDGKAPESKVKEITEAAAAKAYVEAQPVTASRESGQVVKTEWDIQVVNPYDLAKFHPDCVKIEPLLTPIKAALNEGREVKGVIAKKKLTTSVRVTSSNVIDV